MLAHVDRESLDGRDSTLLVAAHPDDEVIGAGARLARWPCLTLVHITDGSPRNMDDARRHGFDTATAYARARRSELESALCAGQVDDCQLLELEIPDQEAALHLVTLTHRLSELIAKLRPQLILTHPYEGGHPDHDACAFALRAACRVSECSRKLYEFTSYHSWKGALRSGEFLSNGENEIFTHRLTEEERSRKQTMLSCFRTQHEMLRQFDTSRESFRAAPDYDFTVPPHDGPLYYERYNWSINGRRFRELAASAARELGLSAL